MDPDTANDLLPQQKPQEKQRKKIEVHFHIIPPNKLNFLNKPVASV